MKSIIKNNALHFALLLLFSLSIFSCNKDYDTNEGGEINLQRNILIDIFNANPNNTLGWDINTSNIGAWHGVTLDANGNLIILDLSNTQLTVLPPSVGQLISLTDLRFKGNNISIIPPEIGQLTNLTNLSFWLNSISAIPKELGQLTSLQNLDFEDNNLTSVPIELGQLTKLQVLWLAKNNLTTIPQGVCDLNVLIDFDSGVTCN